MSKIPTIAMIPSGYKANKLYSVLPTNGDADLTFSRAGEASRINQSGLQEIMASGVPCLDYADGGCPSTPLRPARKNLFLNSETGVTQTITVVSGVDYAVSFSGTGSITFSGGATGTLNGTGANAVDRVSSIVTTSSTSVTCTISGTVEYVNFEINPDNSSVTYATSWIETTGASVTRVEEILSKTGLSSFINSESGVLYIKARPREVGTVQLYSSPSNRIWLEFNESNTRAYLNNGSGAVNLNINSETVDFDSYRKVALLYSENNFKLYVNGVGDTITPTQTTFAANSLSELRFDFGSDLRGDLSEFQIHKQLLTDAELTTLTTL